MVKNGFYFWLNFGSDFGAFFVESLRGETGFPSKVVKVVKVPKVPKVESPPKVSEG
jgi:hypothetical protein